MTGEYKVKKLEGKREIRVQVPGSKSITNRALLLAALSDEKCLLRGILFSDDSRAFLDSLMRLGFQVETDEQKKEVWIQGTGGRIPNRKGTVNVRSAGTAARFLTVFLALAGGEYMMEASEQMCRRPMQPLLQILEKAGAFFEWQQEEGHFPFRMKTNGLNMKEVEIDTGISSQFASALLMSGALQEEGLSVRLMGDRKEGAYIKMTLAMMEQFGISVKKEENSIRVWKEKRLGVKEYIVEPDVSGACYFYAMAPLLKTNVIVKDVHRHSLQGDIKFLEVLERMGCRLTETARGVEVSGTGLEQYPGLELSMKDFSDQTMTMAALAVFAKEDTLIRDIGHIRFQETDRLHAILTELSRMGIACEEVPEASGIRIHPGEVKETCVETYDDHRMAMAFTLVGLRSGNITILNAGCCKKTFENYFELIDQLYEINS